MALFHSNHDVFRRTIEYNMEAPFQQPAVPDLQAAFQFVLQARVATRAQSLSNALAETPVFASELTTIKK